MTYYAHVSRHLLCPACGNNSSRCTNVSFQKHRDNISWQYCLECGSFFDSAEYDEQKEIAILQSADYGKIGQGIALGDFKTRMYRAVLKLMRERCAPPAVLLDVGCSFGGFLLEAQRAGYNVIGMDIIPEAVEYVRSLDVPVELAASIRDIKLVENNTLDIVTCLDCNCYWPNQPEQLGYAFAKLKPGGYLAMRVPNKSWMCNFGLFISKVAPSLGQRILIDSINDHRFSMPLRSLLKVIQSSGFEIIHASPRGAVHSHQTRWIAKLSFVLGSLVWATTGLFVAPGALVLARKRKK